MGGGSRWRAGLHSPSVLREGAGHSCWAAGTTPWPRGFGTSSLAGLPTWPPPHPQVPMEREGGGGGKKGRGKRWSGGTSRGAVKAPPPRLTVPSGLERPKRRGTAPSPAQSSHPPPRPAGPVRSTYLHPSPLSSTPPHVQQRPTHQECAGCLFTQHTRPRPVPRAHLPHCNMVHRCAHTHTYTHTHTPQTNPPSTGQRCTHMLHIL